MNRILVSACLLGEPVRYNGGPATCRDPILEQWIAEGRVVAFCPEMAGGLPSPRPPAEIEPGRTASDVLQGRARVLTNLGRDVTEAFLKGAVGALETARRHGCRIAILKEGSPSCASTSRYDGTFTGTKLEGSGVTTERLTAEGLRVFSEGQLAEAAAYLEVLEQPTS